MQNIYARSAPLKIAFATCRNSASRLGNVMRSYIRLPGSCTATTNQGVVSVIIEK